MTPAVLAQIGAHLWQSTLFAGAAWLIARALRTNRAQVRYWVWLTASVKFLIPFSWLAGVGSLMSHRTAAPIRTEWISAIQEFTEPFAIPPAVARAAVAARPADHGYLAAIALAWWACGFAAVAICWSLRWRRVHALRRSAHAVDLPAGFEIPVPVLSAPDLIEPGVFGILRPVLLLPHGIRERLNSAQLDSILAHELCHVRRRDNLTAAIHMAAQAIFWFHPLTWWLGARLADERERACDEEVVRLGCKPSVYAESILMVCRLYVSSPLACVSGVTGSDLTRRIEAIMRNRRVAGLNPAKKLALAAAAMTALIAPIVIGIFDAPAVWAQAAADWQTAAGGKKAFDVASVKLSQGAFVAPSYPLNAGEAYRPTGGYFRADFPLSVYIEFAYKLWPAEDQEREMLAHLPKWAATDRYTIDARAAGNPTKDQMRLMVQSLLADRFHLATHFETHEGPVLALTLVQAGKLGPKLLPHSDGPPCDKAGAPPGPGLTGFPPGCGSFALIRRSGGALMLAGYRDATLEMLAASLAGIVGKGRPVIDKTGLSGRFDYTLEWAPESTTASAPRCPCLRSRWARRLRRLFATNWG